MIDWRRRLLRGVAFLFCTSVSAVTAAEISVTLDELSGEIEIEGLPQQILDERQPEDILRVAVGPDAPPILGNYRVEAGTLRFQPMFPFDPGREYVVTVETGDEPVVSTVALPALDIEPTTVVTEIYPTAESLPENQLKLYVHFSAPMAGGDGLEHVRLLDENGEEVADPFLPLGDAFWDRDLRRYTIFFDPGRVKRGILPNEEMGRPILDGNRYSLVIDREWRDADGLPLASSYRKEFAAGPPDETPIDPGTWAIHPPRAGTREPLVIDFHEPLDRAVLLRALSVDGVAGEVELAEHESRWRFTPERAWSPGSYELVAQALLEDLAGNQIGKPFEVDVFERIDSPDDVVDIHRFPFVVQD